LGVFKELLEGITIPGNIFGNRSCHARHPVFRSSQTRDGDRSKCRREKIRLWVEIEYVILILFLMVLFKVGKRSLPGRNQRKRTRVGSKDGHCKLHELKKKRTGEKIPYDRRRRERLRCRVRSFIETGVFTDH
jgi:hypothetical protein